MISVNFDRTVRQLRKQYKRQAYKQKYKSAESVKYGQLNKTGQEMGSEEATYGKLYYHFKNFCFLQWEVESNYATVKRFSVKSCA